MMIKDPSYIENKISLEISPGVLESRLTALGYRRTSSRVGGSYMLDKRTRLDDILSGRTSMHGGIIEVMDVSEAGEFAKKIYTTVQISATDSEWIRLYESFDIENQ